MARRRRLFQPPFAGHTVGLAQGEGGNRMAIHGGVAVGRARQAAFGILRLQEEVQAAADIFPISPVEVRVARAEHRQEGQAGHAGIGVGPGVGAAAAVGRSLAAGLVPPGFPAALFALMPGQPAERGLHGGLGLRTAAAGQHGAEVIASDTQLIGLRQRPGPNRHARLSGRLRITCSI